MKITKLIAFMLIISLCVTPCFAEGNLGDNYIAPNFGVSTICPWETLTRGTSSPTQAWNVATQGTYPFSGSASWSRLYLEYLIYGANSFTVVVTNLSSTQPLTVNPHDSQDLNSFTVAPGQTVTKVFVLQSGKQYFCLSFDAPSNFSGSVSEKIWQR